MKEKNTLYRLNCIMSILICSSIIVMFYIGFVSRLIYPEDIVPGTEGLSGFKMFTILSNTIVAVCAAQTIPYAIEGLLTNNYHLPRWIIYTLFVGVSCVTVTMVITAVAIVPVAGLEYAYGDLSSFLFHAVIPFLSVIMFIFFNNFHTISREKTLVALLPLLIYSVLYIVMVFFVKEENGGWSDFYETNRHIPWPVSFVLIISASVILVDMLRRAHNSTHSKKKAEFVQYYLTSDEYDFPSIEQAIEYLASVQIKTDGDLVIPRRKILILMERYNVKESVNHYMKLFIDMLK